MAIGHYFLESMPIAGVYLCIALLLTVSCEVGFLLGRHHHRAAADKEAPGSIGPIVGGMLGMLAFVLAFTFSMAAAQSAVRKQNVLTEANVIGTTYLRADLLPPERAAAAKRLLRDYVGVRLAAARPGSDLEAAVARSLEIHDLLWVEVSTAAREQRDANTAAMVRSTIDLIDMHETRVAGALHARIPISVWIGLATITILTMGTLGLQIGLSGKRRLVGIVPIALAFAVLATLVLDLNRPQGGFITVGQHAMVDLQAAMNRTGK